MYLWILVIAFFVAAAMAYAIGANDVANALGTAVGSRSVSLKGALIIGAIFEFLGAVSMGGNVSDTLQKEITDPEDYVGQEGLFMAGMLSALIGSAVWLLVATWYGLPVSTTHTIVGGIIAFALAAEKDINTERLILIVISWVTSPVLGGLLGYGTYWCVKRYVFSSSDEQIQEASAKRLFPFVFGVTFMVLLLMLAQDVFSSWGELPLWAQFVLAIGGGLVIWGLAATVLFEPILHASRRMSEQAAAAINTERRAAAIAAIAAAKASGAHSKDRRPFTGSIADPERDQEPLLDSTNRADLIEPHHGVEAVFVTLQILTASFVAFAHGANDIANAVGPFAAIWSVWDNGDVTDIAPTSSWIVLFGGVFIVIGLGTLGVPVIRTIGEKVTALVPSKGFSAQLAASLTVLIATYLAIPVSTTHTLVGAVMGVGLVEGRDGVDFGVLKGIFASWIATIPCGAFVSVVSFLVLVGGDALWGPTFF
eukprot:TRINITY_DN2024_c0_g1_i2.p1 TRINITY_DN2024_c0_g1~~TRINITY_DN2024_c0_g1_i2.p1  ORF type:complete len:519 (-),score=116.32 TRINITY_DN2024_c0_g1_i2:24-1466(-)